MKKQLNFAIWSLISATFIFVPMISPAAGTAGGQSHQWLLATKESRRVVVSTEAGGITAIDVSDGRENVGSYHLEFFTLDTGSLFLPVLLHTDMVFYVHTGRGTISWLGKRSLKFLDVEPGDIYRLEEGTVFYIQSSSDTTREKLRIHAIFKSFADDENPNDPFIGAAYSNVTDLVRGFDVEVLQTGFGVSEEVIEEINKAEKPPPIIHFETKRERHKVDWREGVFEALLGRKTFLNDKKKKAFNIMKRKPDVQNRHGRSISVTHKDTKSLKGSSMGMFMVNLTRSSMVGPHWNPDAVEIAIVERGHGMVQMVSASNALGLADDKYAMMRFYVKEGDVFVVPRFHPMAQMSFENESFVFVGFSTNVKKDHPQFLAGKWSVLRTMKAEVLTAAFNVTDAALEQLLAAQEEAVLLGCEGCAEEVQKKLEAEIERKKREEEESRRQEEEERRGGEEEEARKRKQEEEERRRQEEEERGRKKEEEEEERRRQEEEERERIKEEEERKRREEEEARRCEEEERREEEEAKKRKEEKRREEEEAQRRAEEEEQWREEEEEAQRRAEEEAQKRKEEEAQREEEEETQRRAEEEEAQRREEEEEAQRRAEEEEAQRKREEEEAHRRAEEEEEEVQRRAEESEAQRRGKEEEAQRRAEEEEAQGKGEEEESPETEKRRKNNWN